MDPVPAKRQQLSEAGNWMVAPTPDALYRSPSICLSAPGHICYPALNSCHAIHCCIVHDHQPAVFCRPQTDLHLVNLIQNGVPECSQCVLRSPGMITPMRYHHKAMRSSWQGV